ncbi:ester cyclase [Actinomycetes bacterium M1A6_2h]
MTVTVPRAEMTMVADAALHAVVEEEREAHDVFHPDAINHESLAEPPDARGTGPAAFAATGRWLRAAFDDATWTTTRHVVDGDLVVSYGLLSGRQTGDFVVWTPDATVERAFSPTRKTFEVRQAHFQRVVDGLVVEHWAVRDDQAMGLQLGWVPPSPLYLLRCHRATSRARRAHRR